MTTADEIVRVPHFTEEELAHECRSGDPKTPTDKDKFIGSQIRMYRRELKMSLEKLGEDLGLTFQQVQKYENGTNRVSAGRLHDIACVLGKPVAAFYDGLDDPVTGEKTECVLVLGERDRESLNDVIASLKALADPMARGKRNVA